MMPAPTRTTSAVVTSLLSLMRFPLTYSARLNGTGASFPNTT